MWEFEKKLMRSKFGHDDWKNSIKKFDWNQSHKQLFSIFLLSHNIIISPTNSGRGVAILLHKIAIGKFTSS